jgi:hypothetical protein
MNVLEKVLLFEPSGGMFREFVGINTYLEPKDLSLYRKLLPEPYTMPDQPIVTIFVADYIKVVPWPMTRYQEWAVNLKSIWNGEEGWYVATMPVTKWVPMVGGRYRGFPKYIVDAITLRRTDRGWIGESNHKGVLKLRAEFEPGLTRQLAGWEKELLENKSFFNGDVHLLVPPGQGPRAQKVRLNHVVSPQWSPELGMVRIEVDRNEPWAELVPAGISFPGTYNHFIGGMNLVTMKLN